MRRPGIPGINPANFGPSPLQSMLGNLSLQAQNDALEVLVDQLFHESLDQLDRDPAVPTSVGRIIHDRLMRAHEGNFNLATCDRCHTRHVADPDDLLCPYCNEWDKIREELRTHGKTVPVDSQDAPEPWTIKIDPITHNIILFVPEDASPGLTEFRPSPALVGTPASGPAAVGSPIGVAMTNVVPPTPVVVEVDLAGSLEPVNRNGNAITRETLDEEFRHIEGTLPRRVPAPDRFVQEMLRDQARRMAEEVDRRVIERIATNAERTPMRVEAPQTLENGRVYEMHNGSRIRVVDAREAVRGQAADIVYIDDIDRDGDDEDANEEARGE